MFLLLGISRSYAQFVNYEIKENRPFAVLPFELHNDFIIVKLNLEGMLPLNFVLDSGSAHTILLHKEYGDMCRLRYGKRLYIRGVDRSRMVSALLCNGVMLDFESIIADNQNILVLEDSFINIGKYSGSKVDGILGMDIFQRFIVNINFETRMLYLFEPNEYTFQKDNYEAIPFSHKDGKMFISAKSKVAGVEKEVDWLIDTGAALNVLFRANDQDTLLIPENARPGNIGRGLGGFVLGYLGRVERVDFGDYAFDNIQGNFQQLPDSLYLPPENGDLEGMLGNKIFKKFHLIFDYHQKTLYVHPNKFYYSEENEDLSGVYFTASGLHLNQFEVEEVAVKSPAGKAGILPGDQLLKINGSRNYFVTLQGLNKRLSAKEGKKIKLLLLRDGKKIKTVFELEKYLN